MDVVFSFQNDFNFAVISSWASFFQEEFFSTVSIACSWWYKNEDLWETKTNFVSGGIAANMLLRYFKQRHDQKKNLCGERFFSCVHENWSFGQKVILSSAFWSISSSAQKSCSAWSGCQNIDIKKNTNSSIKYQFYSWLHCKGLTARVKGVWNWELNDPDEFYLFALSTGIKNLFSDLQSNQ